MINLLNVLMALLFVLGLAQMIYSRNGKYLLIGVTSLFAIGYYVLPLLSLQYSGLEGFSEEEIIPVLWMSFLYFISLMLGYWYSTELSWMRKISPVELVYLDLFYVKYFKIIFYIGLALWLVYFFNTETTSYQADSIETFVFERQKFSGLFSLLAGFGLSAMAVSLAISIESSNRKSIILMASLYISIIVLMLSTAQRLAVITPIFTLVASLAVFGRQKMALKLVVYGIVVLLIVSPLMVFLREFRDSSSGIKVFSAVDAFSIVGDSIFSLLFESILNRADLLKNMIILKAYFDTVDTISVTYYMSVLYSFVPSFIFFDKPYPLSDTGTIFGEISVLAWSLLNQGSSIGSLTAFGAISAYREGGWLWVPINGFITGGLFAAIFLLFGRSGIVNRWFFSFIFVSVCIKNVPPSALQLIVNISGAIVLYLIILIANSLFKLRS